MFARWFGGFTILAVMVLALSSVGCNQQPSKPAEKKQAKADDKKKEDSKHDDWWCQEHGVPEEMCSLCSAEAAAKLKKEGDWCKEHDRAKSQCFKCDPSKYEKFEQMYMAKYNGKKPQRPPQEEFTK
ncbi:MAG TPA: hypothetical protein VFE62_14220 [Gemmataceae bacterium]|nr:hypothetical protein [Gemmataceae bacterium]